MAENLEKPVISLCYGHDQSGCRLGSLYGPTGYMIGSVIFMTVTQRYNRKTQSKCFHILLCNIQFSDEILLVDSQRLSQHLFLSELMSVVGLN